MNHNSSVVVRALVILVMLAAGITVPAKTTPNVNDVCGVLASDTTWSLVNSPYKVCNTFGVTVPQNRMLKVDPGVTVQFADGAGAKLYVQGTLVANGTVTQTITFTRGVTSTTTWGGIYADGTLGSPAQVNISNITIDHGGVGGSFGAGVYADHTAITITHSIIQNGAGSGIYATNNTHFNLQTLSFLGNSQDAIFLNTPKTDLLMSNLSASGNGNNSIRINGATTWSGQRRWAYPGMPYIVDGQMINNVGDILTIDPGNKLLFTSNGFMSIGGRLNAVGTSSDPILMTSQTNTVGSWRGLVVYGGSQKAIAQLDYVTIEDAGSDVGGANIEVNNGQLIANHSIIRKSIKDGVRFNSNSGGSIIDSQIISNTLYGVRNPPPFTAVLATNDWWGDPLGPKSDLTTCSSGNGQPVTSGVLFKPVLTDTNISAPLPLSSYPNLTLTPRRWFAPADNTTRVYFDITLRDGNGTPIPGRTVKLASSLGFVTDGGVTDANGKTLAYITSPSPGDATVTASLDATSACEGVLSPTAKVTFTTPINITDLLPNAPASYFDGDIQVRPLPVVVGITTSISVKLTNPLTTPVTVDVSFGFAQSGIGLVFGPIKDINGQVIPGNSSVVVSTDWLPVVSGHYCVQVSYNITGVGPAFAKIPQAGRQLKQFNLNVQQSKTGNPNKDADLSKTRNSLKAVNMFVDRTYDTGPIAVPLYVANKGIGWDLNTAEKISNALNGDPPRQDYTQIDLPVKLTLPPIQPGPGISPAYADALNQLDDALAWANAYGTASTTALDRAGGASAAGDLQWNSTQTGVMLEYNKLMGTEIITAAMKIDNLINVLGNEGIHSVIITSEDVVTMQQKLSTNGFSTQEKADAHAVGLTDADIDSLRQRILAANPQDLAGDLIPKMQDLRDQFYLLGGALLNPDVFFPVFSVSGSAGLRPLTAYGNTMAQVYDTSTTIQLSNPLTQTTQINVTARRIDLPAEWAVDVSPTQITLGVGQQTTVTVSIIAGTPVPQGSLPRVAVEGYAGSRLLGGVVVDIMVPKYTPFDGKLHLYLPMVN
jgi:hypothetical protein